MARVQGWNASLVELVDVRCRGCEGLQWVVEVHSRPNMSSDQMAWTTRTASLSATLYATRTTPRALANETVANMLALIVNISIMMTETLTTTSKTCEWD